MTAVTYLGTVYGTLAALRRMRPRDQGVVVQVSSALAFRSIPFQALYCGAKHATKGLTESLRSELLREGSNVRMTMVHLPALNTPQFDIVKSRLPRQPKPVPPIYQPETAAEAVLWAIERTPRDLYVGFSRLTAVTARWRRAWSTGTSPGPASKPSRRRSPSSVDVRTTSGRRCRAITERGAASTTEARSLKPALVDPHPPA